MESVSINVGGMACGHCKMAVEKALSALEGVKNAKVSIEERKVDVKYDADKTSLEDIKKAIVDAGYSLE